MHRKQPFFMFSTLNGKTQGDIIIMHKKVPCEGGLHCGTSTPVLMARRKSECGVAFD